MCFSFSMRPAGIRWVGCLLWTGLFLTPAGRAEDRLATPAEMAASPKDLWGEASLRRPEGPSYEFFRDLLPPLRYVDTAFRHYPWS